MKLRTPLSKLERRSLRYIKGGRDGICPITLDGTTFSGDPVTTLGNTLRTICYVNYYLRNIPSEHYRIFAAGDDVMVVAEADIMPSIKIEFLRHTARDSNGQCAIGQVVKTVSVGDFNTAEFCSKWFFSDGTVYATRDYRKTLLTRQFYSRQNR
jgi:hypothetical protein